MGMIIEDLYDHEGFGARRLPDGSGTGIWSAKTAAVEAYVAAAPAAVRERPSQRRQRHHRRQGGVPLVSHDALFRNAPGLMLETALSK